VYEYWQIISGNNCVVLQSFLIILLKS
jgi:hypothetical protein